jgi:hypothetical protein
MKLGASVGHLQVRLRLPWPSWQCRDALSRLWWRRPAGLPAGPDLAVDASASWPDHTHLLGHVCPTTTACKRNLSAVLQAENVEPRTATTWPGNAIMLVPQGAGCDSLSQAASWQATKK